MEFEYIPNFANNYNFVTCYKEKDADIWKFYSVADTMNEAQIDIKFLRKSNYDFLVIINVSNYERGNRNDD